LQRRPLIDWLLLGLLAAVWGTAFVFIKLTLDTIPPATLVALRLLIAASVLTIVMRIRGLRLPRPGSAWGPFFVMGLIGNAVPFLLISWGQLRVDSGVTGVLMGVMPLATVLLAHFFIQGERMTTRVALGFGIGFVGLGFLSGPEALRELGGEPSELVRQAAILTAAVCYSVNTIIARRFVSHDALVTSTSVMWAASLLVLPFSLWFDRPWTIEASQGSILAVIWLGVVSTGLAMVVYYRVVQTAGPTFLSLMNYMIPVVALVSGVVAMGETVQTPALIGLACILVGLSISQLAASRGTKIE
jgi:drug/metabolite transporter (DMT)-like permease